MSRGSDKRENEAKVPSMQILALKTYSWWRWGWKKVDVIVRIDEENKPWRIYFNGVPFSSTVSFSVPFLSRPAGLLWTVVQPIPSSCFHDKAESNNYCTSPHHCWISFSLLFSADVKACLLGLGTVFTIYYLSFLVTFVFRRQIRVAKTSVFPLSFLNFLKNTHQQFSIPPFQMHPNSHKTRKREKKRHDVHHNLEHFRKELTQKQIKNKVQF